MAEGVSAQSYSHCSKILLFLSHFLVDIKLCRSCYLLTCLLLLLFVIKVLLKRVYIALHCMLYTDGMKNE